MPTPVRISASPRRIHGSLRSLPLTDSYRSAHANIARDFYVPCLRAATRYSRAVGYFTSTSLSVAAAGLGGFLDGGGRMRLVASPHLSPEDFNAIQEGYRARDAVVEDALARELAPEYVPDPIRERLAFLAWLIAEGRLDIKVALVDRDGDIGLYHEKFGIFEDEHKDYVAFSGSANESFGGLISNFEVIDVFRSWIRADASRASNKRREFEELWQRKTPDLDIYDFPDAARERLLELRPSNGKRPAPLAIELGTEPDVTDGAPAPTAVPRVPRELEIRDYQRAAIDAWLAKRGRGIWEMATGTGKTITALTAVTHVAGRAASAKRPLLTVVAAPLKHLVTQWGDEARRFGVQPVLCFDSATRWVPRATDLAASLRGSSGGFGLIITTNDTFAGARFQEFLQGWAGLLMLVVDEVHNAGAKKMLSALPDRATYRLGLSATPNRWFDEEGTQAITDYFGDPVFSLTLADAVTQGILSPYRYFPIQVHLTADESEEYMDLSRKIGRLARGGADLDDADSSGGALRNLLFARARLVGGASGKLDALRAVMSELRDSTHTLVYCSDAKMADDDGEATRQLDAAVDLLGNDLGMRVNSYTNVDDAATRIELRKGLESGDLQALVAIRCLDEGVDIPEVRRAFILASSTNPRQFIQRRGRILRRAPGKERADLYDFLVVPPDAAFDSEDFETERRLVRRELRRVIEFAETAENGPEALASLLPLRDRYQLLDEGYGSGS